MAAHGRSRSRTHGDGHMGGPRRGAPSPSPRRRTHKNIAETLNNLAMSPQLKRSEVRTVRWERGMKHGVAPTSAASHTAAASINSVSAEDTSAPHPQMPGVAGWFTQRRRRAWTRGLVSVMRRRLFLF